MNNWELDILMLHLIRIPSMRMKALEQMSGVNMFDELMNPIHYNIWQILMLVEKHQPGSNIPLLFIKGELNNAINDMDDFRDYATEADTFIKFCEDTPEDQLSETHGDKYLTALILDNVRKGLLTKAESLYSLQEMDAFINDVSQINIQPKAANNMCEPLMNIAQFLNEAPLVKTGVDPLDLVSGGGMPRATVNGLLGPTGGGKTMLTYQVAMGQAKKKQHVLVNTYEQGIEGDISQRLCSGMLEVDISELRKPWDQWTKEHQEKFLKFNPHVGPYVHINDMTLPGQGCLGIKDIAASYEVLCSRGEEPTYIIVDWLKPLIMRYLVSNNMETNDANWRQQAYLFLDQCGQFVKDTNTIMIVNHQLDTMTSRASPRKKPVVTDAMELKSFAFNIDACYLIGNRDKDTNVAWMLTDKNRRGAPLDMLVRMNGPLARFDEASGFLADHRGKFIKEDEMNAMPDISDSEKGEGMSNSYM